MDALSYIQRTRPLPLPLIWDTTHILPFKKNGSPTSAITVSLPQKTMLVRTKQVTDPLDDNIKARLCGYGIPRLASGYSSSGSDHDAVDPSYFSGPVHAFFETNETSQASDDNDGLVPNPEAESNLIHSIEIVHDVLNPKDDQFRIRLLSDASSAAESLAALRPTGSGYRRAVMGKLRAGGYNAGLCKVKWERSGGLTAGSYEYIDVVLAAERYIVDLDFAAEFEIARATEEYRRFMAALPRVMVGTPEEVRQVVKLVAKAAGSSLRSKGLSLPPWRKGKYMSAKWLGPYRRTTNVVPSSAGATAADQVKCRAVGFGDSGGLGLHATGRIR